MSEPEKKPLHVVALEAENIKILKAIRIEPNGTMEVLGGDNENGKSSVLDCIDWGITGKPNQPMVVRKGESKARILIDLGDLKLVRRFTRDETGKENSYLEVTNAEGAKYSSPQTMLDRLFGGGFLDPLEFMRLKAKDQIDRFKQITGLAEQFAAIDVERKTAYDERTLVNRDLEGMKARFEGKTFYDDAPAGEQSAAALTAELQELLDRNNKNAQARSQLKLSQQSIDAKTKPLADANAAVTRLRKELADAEEHANTLQKAMSDAQTALSKMRVEVEALQDEPTAELESRLSEIEGVNQKVRQNKAITTARQEWAAKEAKRVELTKKVDECDAKKVELLASSQLPIDGLALTDDGLTLGGIPFEQCSSAAQLKVCFALMAATKPRLRVALVRDGSLLDQNSLKELAQIAASHEYQVWVERVSKGKECSVIIEDGEVRPNLQVEDGGS